MGLSPTQMRGPERAEEPGVEEITGDGLLPEQTVLGYLAPLVAQPPPDRRGQPVLGPIDDARWQSIGDSLRQQVLAAATPQLECGRYARGELDDFLIEQRRPDFQTVRHARPVHFHENSVHE